MADPIRILIADDHTIFRSGLKLLLNSEPDMQIVGEVEDGEGAIRLAGELRPDVILMDIGMPKVNGIEATRQIHETYPEVHILVLTMHRSEEYFFQMLSAGASGYILKAADTDQLISAVRTVGRGEVFLYPSMAERLVKEYLRGLSGAQAETSQITDREREVLRLIAEGFSNKEIAERLVISPSTVHSHRTNIMRKLNISKRHELVQYARRHGLLRGS